MSTPILIVIILAGISIYFIPTITAYVQEKRNKGPVFVVNLFLGWSFIGWFIALFMAVSKDKHLVIHHDTELLEKEYHTPGKEKKSFFPPGVITEVPSDPKYRAIKKI